MVMTPDTEVEQYLRSEDEIAASNAKLVELRKDHNFASIGNLPK